MIGKANAEAATLAVGHLSLATVATSPDLYCTSLERFGDRAESRF
jgi:hypothetical protein